MGSPQAATGKLLRIAGSGCTRSRTGKTFVSRTTAQKGSVQANAECCISASGALGRIRGPILRALEGALAKGGKLLMAKVASDRSSCRSNLRTKMVYKEFPSSRT